MEGLVCVRDDDYCNDNSFSDSRVSSSTYETTSSSEEKQSFGAIHEELLKETFFSDIIPAKDERCHLEDEKTKTSVSDIEMMKERFAKLLLGEDMSGCGHGVCTALSISNAITNLYATLFGQLWKLEPFPAETKSIWRREIEWLLCVSDHIVELRPSWQTFPDGSKLEVMTCRPRSDLYINIPALRKLDHMLLEILDSFRDSEFWYDDQGMIVPDSDGSTSFRTPFQRQEGKWWLPVPHIPPSGLQENSRKQLQIKRECASQILKDATAINSNVLAEMEVRQPYLDSLPKNARDSLGEVMYRYITSDQFSADCVLDCLEFSSEYQVLEVANRVEASVQVWRQKTRARARGDAVHANPKTLSWGLVREKIVDGVKWELFADRAESLLICLKQRFPGLTQTSLDMSKFQFNKDVGKSILESYSRVLESLAFNIVARIDDLLYVDDLTKQSDQFSSVPSITAIAHKRVTIPYSVPISSTPYATAYSNPSFSPAPVLLNSTRGERAPFINRKASSRPGFCVKKVLTDYLTGNSSTSVEFWASISKRNHEGLAL